MYFAYIADNLHAFYVNLRRQSHEFPLGALFSSCLASLFRLFSISQFACLYYYGVNKDLLSDILSRHQNWYIQKDLCLVHSKFPTAIEAMIAVCFTSLVFE